MRRVALIYNPASGQLSKGRRAAIDKALGVLRAAGIEAEALETTAPGSAGPLAQQAAHRGCDAIIACGGDGTVHEVLQGLVGTQVALGVVPLGTANALAANLGLQTSPAKAVARLLTAQPTRIAVGKIYYQDATGVTCSRHFTVAAGIGADAHFMSLLNPVLKRRLGYLLYVIEAFRVWFTYPFPLFEAAFTQVPGAEPRVEQVSELLAVRIRNFGGLIRNFLPGATLHHGQLRLAAFKTRSRLRYFGFMIPLLFGRHRYAGKVEALDALSVECRLLPGCATRVFAEADGEYLGELPIRMEIVPDALTLLIPLGVKA
ncbi:MAG: diacylglycerol kinase family protein [Terracidiphilus sp.]